MAGGKNSKGKGKQISTGDETPSRRRNPVTPPNPPPSIPVSNVYRPIIDFTQMTPEATRQALSFFPSPHMSTRRPPVPSPEIPFHLLEIDRNPQYSPLTTQFSQMHASHSSQSSTHFSSSESPDFAQAGGSFQHLLGEPLLASGPGLDDMAPGFTQYSARSGGAGGGSGDGGSSGDGGDGGASGGRPEQVDSPGRRGRRRPRTAASRWAWDEEEILLSSWIHVSTDGTVGADQAGDCFWRKVHHECKQSRRGEFFNGKTRGSVKKHFGDLNNKLKVYAGCYERALRQAGSGTNEADVDAAAARDYTLLKGSWRLQSHWQLVRDQPAWRSYAVNPKEMAYQMRKPSKSGSASSGKRSRISGDDDSEDTPASQFVFPARPPGREAQKKAKAASGSGSKGKGKGVDTEAKLAQTRSSRKEAALEHQRALINKDISRQEMRRAGLLETIISFRRIDRSNYTPAQHEFDDSCLRDARRDIDRSKAKEEELLLQLAKLNSLETLPSDSDSDSDSD